MKRIGIIGAAGVAATNRLCVLIEEEMLRRGAFRDAHHPDMVIVQCTQVPSRSMYLEGKGDSFIPGYAEVGLHLKEFGCREIAMCCNTAHYAIDELQQIVDLPFVNVLNLVAKEAKQIDSRRVGIICGNGCRKFELYDSAFKHVAPEIEVIYPSPEYQQVVTKGICGAKTSLRFEDKFTISEHPFNCFADVCRHLENKGVDTIICGCTDICNVFDGEIEWDGVKVIDSLRAMTRYIIQHYSNV